ncbi:hypothetical protein M9458_029640, partial [Cirrhinus mrigala]
ASWKWYRAIDEAVGGRPFISPPALIASSGLDDAVASTSSVSPAQDTPRASKRSHKSMEALIRKMEERESAREQEAVEKEEKRWREKEDKSGRRDDMLRTEKEKKGGAWKQ